MLTDLQKLHLPTIEWLINDFNHLEGKSHLLAMAFIVKAVKYPEREVFIFDHYLGSKHNLIRLMDMIKGFIHTNEVLCKMDWIFNHTSFKCEIITATITKADLEKIYTYNF